MKNRIILLIFWAVFTAVFTGPPIGIAGEKTVSELVEKVIGPPSCTIINFGRHNYGNARKELAEVIESFNHMVNEGKDPYEELVLEYGPYGYSCKSLMKKPTSGVIISESGHVLTVAHGVGPEADNIVYIAWSYAEEGPRMLYPTKIVKANMELDMIELEILGSGIRFPTIKWGDSNEVKTGDELITISSPYGLPFTFGSCRVGNATRSKNSLKGLLNYKDIPCETMIQLSGVLHGGDSGAPAFGAKTGHLYGFVQSRMNRAPDYSNEASGGEEKRFFNSENENSIGISFLIPANEVKKWLEGGK